ncbi:TM2 domain-containing protein [Chromohalobacter canadensis]|uniref:TM2 domain-containing protein n=1 Tax=Chromohalobacter canadensis TaxID=141389 RepID=UPI0021C11FC6|nr:NINE protein [Chromohalobacter canadensis]
MSEDTMPPQASQPAQTSGSKMIYCHGCGKQVHESARSCPHCGAESNVRTGSRTKVAAALLAFFLGGFGVHRFYLGNIGLGFLYLLFCWTFIPALIAFGEFIYFLCLNDRDFDRKYNH